MTSSVDTPENDGSSPDLLLASLKGQVDGHRVAFDAIARRLEEVVRQSATSASQSRDIIGALRDRIDDLNTELSAQRDMHADAVERLAASERQFATALSAARAQVLAIQSSTSWRVSAPVRLLGRAVIRSKQWMKKSSTRGLGESTLDSDIREIDAEPEIRSAWLELMSMPQSIAGR